MKKLVSIITLLATLLTLTAVFASCGGAQKPQDTSPKAIDSSENVEWYVKYDESNPKNPKYTLYIKGDKDNPTPMFSEAVEITETTAATEAATEATTEAATEATTEAATEAATEAEKTTKTVYKAKTGLTADDMPWKSLRSSITHVEISGVTDIPDYAFYNMISLMQVSFGDSVTSIGKFAFAFCASLSLDNMTDKKPQPILLPKGITTIGESAFEACSNITSITLPETVTEVGDHAFAYTYKLKTLVKPETLKLPDNAFDIISGNKVVANDNVKIEALSEKNPEAPEGESKDESEETSAPATDKPSSENNEDKTEEEKPNKTSTIIAIVVIVVVVIGVIVGAVLLYRSNKKQTKDARTVRKTDEEKNAKNNKNNKKGKKK